MKTTVELNGRLLSRARKVIRARTMRQTLDAALRALLAQAEREKLRRELGTFDIALTPSSLERSRRDR